MKLIQRLTVFVLVAVLVSLVLHRDAMGEIDRKALKTGMTLPEVVKAFGQPDRMEWVNANGQSVLFVFFESQRQGVLSLFPIPTDTVQGPDGRSLLPLGFLQEGLIGWGKKYYERAKQPQ